MAQIEVRNLSKVYHMGDNEVFALRDVSLSIEQGEFVAIMGPSGSGKSTLMHILGLLDGPSSGSYLLQGREVSKLNERELAVLRRQQIGFIFQQFNLLNKMSATENVALPLLYSQGRVDQVPAQELLKKVGLGDRLANRPNQMSGGQQQRVAIARSLINQPANIFADEPTGNLDSTSAKDVIAILKQLNSQGMTVVIVTHEEEIGQQAERILRFRDGQLIGQDQGRGVAHDSHSDGAAGNVSSDLFRKSKRDARETQKFDFFFFIEHVREGLRSLAANKVRTLLSVLGILIGVAAVIAMLALGAGAQKAIEQQLASLGTNLLVVRPGASRVGGIFQDSGTSMKLTLDDVEALKTQLGGVRDASPNVMRRVQVTYKNKNWNTQGVGAGASYARIHVAEPQVGRFFDEEENRKRNMVVVIGMTLVRELFGEQNPIGELIKINRINFQVIGVLPAKGANGWRDQDDLLVIPALTAMKRLLGRDHIDFIELEAERTEEMENLQSAAMNLMLSRHRVPPSQKDNAFDVRNMSELKAAMAASSQTMSVLLAVIAAISLLVGGIGIMNIMLVSVTERTREVGLRKAVGARQLDILLQFLVEAVVISTCGGLVGIFLGWAITLALSTLAGWTTTISALSVIVSFFFAVSIGVIFGIFPAHKASTLHPIQALRHD